MSKILISRIILESPKEISNLEIYMLHKLENCLLYFLILNLSYYENNYYNYCINFQEGKNFNFFLEM